MTSNAHSPVCGISQVYKKSQEMVPYFTQTGMFGFLQLKYNRKNVLIYVNFFGNKGVETRW